MNKKDLSEPQVLKSSLNSEEVEKETEKIEESEDSETKYNPDIKVNIMPGKIAGKNMNKKETEKIEESEDSPRLSDTERIEQYLVDVVGCLMDVRMALDGAKMGASIEKGDLIRVGRDFSYQQGIIDVCSEISKYASGEIDLQEAVKELLEAKRKIMEGQQQATPDGMEVL